MKNKKFKIANTVQLYKFHSEIDEFETFVGRCINQMIFLFFTLKHTSTFFLSLHNFNFIFQMEYGRCCQNNVVYIIHMVYILATLE